MVKYKLREAERTLGHPRGTVREVYPENVHSVFHWETSGPFHSESENYEPFQRGPEPGHRWAASQGVTSAGTQWEVTMSP